MNGKFDIKDSGKREEMETGSVRDTQEGKPRPDLIPPITLFKLAMHYAKGAEKYDANNWKLGQKISRYNASLKRHIMGYGLGVTDEPHRIAAIWNLIAIDWTLDMIDNGLLPKELDDRPADEREGNPVGVALWASVYGGENAN